MMMKDKVVLVTGAGRGIGRAMAIMMAQEGAKVVVNDLGAGVGGEETGESPAEEVVATIRAAGGEAVINGDNVASLDGAEAMIQDAIDNFGRIDTVVNNAGILRDRIFHKMSPEEWSSVINVHLNGSFNTAHFAAKHFKKQESGSFVFMTSTSGLIGNFGQANYSAAKAGIASLSKSIALDMQRYNVRSNCISPFAWSRMIGAIPVNTPEEKARVDKLKEMTPEKIAPMAVYLASDSASDVSGQIFAVRNNEVFLMGQSRPLRSTHRSEGWTPQTISEHAIPALKSSFYPLDRSADVFSWDPV
ncbi:MAG TPA: SDR family oxidoreductase [Cycloclasticus sp.]|jgi:NAD(P)-dependent dehydrogenase (short-subunit alcohol dehydrogenase family)|nr:SDR family oxidoreductase [Cycloclasticus sp.]HIL92843.1 SDR family oxidoreductase [Cycloclasticus sp.]